MRASGPGRFAQVAEAWSDLADQAIITGDPGLRGCGPLLLGGFGFADVPARTPVWRGFEAADVVAAGPAAEHHPGGHVADGKSRALAW